MRLTKKYVHVIFYCSYLLVLSICLFYRVLTCSPTTGAAVWLYNNLGFRLIFDAEFIACSQSLLLSLSLISQERGKSSSGNSGRDLGLVCLEGNRDAADSSCLALQMQAQRQYGYMTHIRATWFCSKSKIVSLRASWSTQGFPSVLSSWK